jgi:heme oxygenase
VHYVIEGSQLGGAVLYERLRVRLAPHPLRYLKGDAAGPGPRWRAFTQALRADVRTAAEIADACAGACAAFDRILELHAGSHPASPPRAAAA